MDILAAIKREEENLNPNGADEGFNYSARGELINFYQVTSATLVWYDATATYWPNGALNTLRLFSCLNSSGCTTGGPNEIAATPQMTYSADGEGRPSSISASSGQNPVTSTAYNAGSLPTAVTLGSSDNDAFTYDPNTFRLTKYQFNIGAQSYIGALTWNANGTLGSLGITDPFNSADTQSCNYSHDDLVRIASVNCGAATWQQNFTYDAFGNITKTVPAGGTGNSFQPTYSTSTNHITSISGFTPTYDANGDVTNDSNHTYAWDAFGNPTTIDGVGITYDGLDRMVEQNRAGSFSEITYSPTGFKMQIMNGATAKTDYVPLPGGAMLVYSASAPSGGYWIRHPDWLGSSRLASNPNRTIFYDGAYAPFGEPYAQSGTADLSFTGMDQDTSTGLYDFPAREYSTQGRWPSPDSAGLGAVDPSNPQSWNRCAYVMNSPLVFDDPTGLDPCQGANTFWFSQAADGTGILTQNDCSANGGTWDDGPGGASGGGGVGNSFLNGSGGGDPGPGFPGDPTPGCTPTFDSDGNQNGLNCPSGSSGGGQTANKPASLSGGTEVRTWNLGQKPKVNWFANSNCQFGFLNSKYGPGAAKFASRFSLLGWSPLASGPSASSSDTIVPTIATEGAKVGTGFLLKLGGASSQSLSAFSVATLIPTLLGTAYDAESKYACKDVTGTNPQGW